MPYINSDMIRDTGNRAIRSIFVLEAEPLTGLWSAGGAFNLTHCWRLHDDGVRWTPSTPNNAAQWDQKITALHEQATERRQSRGSLRLSRTSAAEATWSLPAIAACPVRDETCNHCYALGGWYRLDISHQVDRVLRLEYLRQLIREGRIDTWTTWMVAQIRKLRPVEPFPALPDNVFLPENLRCGAIAYFRWHDSGDLFDQTYARAVFRVCEATPGVAHWLPTRMGAMLAQLVARGVVLPPNLSLIVSVFSGGKLEQRQLASVREILRVQPSARIGLGYFHNSAKKRDIDQRETVSKLGSDVVICPCQIAKNPKDRVCAGCRRCWASSIHSPIVYARS